MLPLLLGPVGHANHPFTSMLGEQRISLSHTHTHTYIYIHTRTHARARTHTHTHIHEGNNEPDIKNKQLNGKREKTVQNERSGRVKKEEAEETY